MCGDAAAPGPELESPAQGQHSFAAGGQRASLRRLARRCVFQERDLGDSSLLGPAQDVLGGSCWHSSSRSHVYFEERFRAIHLASYRFSAFFLRALWGQQRRQKVLRKLQCAKTGLPASLRGCGKPAAEPKMLYSPSPFLISSVRLSRSLLCTDATSRSSRP